MSEDAKHSHLIPFPEALEALFSRMGELKIVLGPAAAPGVDEVERLLREGLAARERGDPPAAIDRIARAMDHLAALATHAEPAEGAMMPLCDRSMTVSHDRRTGEALTAFMKSSANHQGRVIKLL